MSLTVDSGNTYTIASILLSGNKNLSILDGGSSGLTIQSASGISGIVNRGSSAPALAIAVPLTLANNLNVVNAGTTNSTTINITGTIGGTGNITSSTTSTSRVNRFTNISNTGSFTVGDTAAFTSGGGATVIASTNLGTTEVRGTFAPTGSITVNSGTLSVNNSGANYSASAKINTTGGLNLNGGSFFALVGDTTSGNSTTGTIGTITLGKGLNNIILNQGVAANTSTLLTSAGLSRSAGQVLRIGNVTVGQGTVTDNIALLRFSSLGGISQVGGTGTFASGTDTNIKIIPYLFSASENGTGSTASAFVGYDATNDTVRALKSTEYNSFTGSSANLSSGFSDQNVRIGHTGATMNITGGAVNALAFDVNGASSDRTYTLSGTLTVDSGAVLFTKLTGSTRAQTLTGGILDFGSVEGFITSTNNTNATINSQITGSGGLTLSGTTPTNPSIIVLGSTSNSYSGQTHINGQVRLGNSGVIPDGSSVWANSGGTFDVYGKTESIDALNGSGVVDTLLASTAASLTVGASNGSGTFSGIIRNSGTSATLDLTKTGSGTQTLSGASTYTGATIVNGGTLLVSGTLTGTSGVTANTGGTFRYDGTAALDRAVNLNGGTFSYNSATNYGGTLTYNSGTIAGSNISNLDLSFGTGQTMSPGNSTGTMAAGNTTWATGGSFLFEVNDATGTAGSTTAGWDLVNAASLNITAGVGEFTLQIASLDSLQAAGNALNFDGTSNYTWLFVDAGASITGFSAGSFILDDSAFTNSAPGTFSITQGTGVDDDKLYINYAGVIPEPSTYAMLIGGLGLLAFLRRRSKS